MPRPRSPKGGVPFAIAWALAVGVAIALGKRHGHVPEELREAMPYEFGAVLCVSMLIAAESVALFWILHRAPIPVAALRSGAAAAACAAMLLGSAALINDAPGSWYADTLWAMVMTLGLATLLVEQLAVAAWRRLARARRSA